MGVGERDSENGSGYILINSDIRVHNWERPLGDVPCRPRPGGGSDGSIAYQASGVILYQQPNVRGKPLWQNAPNQ